MSHPTLPPADGPDADAVPQLEIVVPVYNEAQQLAASITSLRTFLDRSFPLTTVVTVADNASTDDTWTIASGLAASLPGVRALHLDQKGRGRALRAAWTASRSPVVAYMDVDLATGLEALLPLVAPLLTGHSDVAIGTRLAPGAHVVRGARREIISRSYNLLLRTVLGASCSDAQCGFKAMRREAVDVVLPLVEDQAWFFDTEVLVTAQRLGLRIHEVPVDWVDDLDSRVAVAHTAWLDLCGVARMTGPTARRRAARGPPVAARDASVTRHRRTAVPRPTSGPQQRRIRQGRGRGVRRRAAPLRRRRHRQHPRLRGPLRPARALDGRLRGQRRGHRRLRARQHGRPPGHGRQRPPRSRPCPPARCRRVRFSA